MKPIPFSMKGTEYALTLKVTTYPEGNLAIKLYQESFGQLVFWDSLTANLGGLCPKDCGYINTKSTGKRFYAWIKRNGLGERTGQVRLEDGVEYVEYLFNAKKLKKLDPEGYTYYERRLKGELGRRYERLALHTVPGLGNDLTPLFHLKLHTIFALCPFAVQFQLYRIRAGQFIARRNKADQVVLVPAGGTSLLGHLLISGFYADDAEPVYGVVVDRPVISSSMDHFFFPPFMPPRRHT